MTITRRPLISSVGYAAAVGVLAPAIVRAAPKVSILMEWLTQGSFSGYCVALEKGFYSQEGIGFP
jgi:ABC-type nitrate/sulfonate/bicarbonate transport system substrate-binding protein